MSGKARQSYYEIALTSRQVISVFVVLLIAVLAAFLGGLWVGRRAAGPQVETVEAQAIESGTEEGDEPLERFEFFSRNEESGDGDAPAGEPERTAELEAPEPEAPAPAIVEDEPAEETSAPVDDEPALEPEAEIAEGPAEVQAPVEAEVTPEAPVAGSMVVQVFSSNNQVQAQSVVDQLRSGGFPALLSPVEVSGRTMYRVRIGPYGDRQVAEGIAQQVREQFRLETWITQ